jgi:hypothetical protein
MNVFPALQYQFSPKILKLKKNDLIHFQWTGSDYNPDRWPNSAEGGPSDPFIERTFRADRHNIIQIKDKKSVLPLDFERNTLFVDSNGKPDKNLINKFAFIGINSSSCLTWVKLLEKNNNDEMLARLGLF